MPETLSRRKVQSEIFGDPPGGLAFVQRVEVQALDSFLDQFSALFGGILGPRSSEGFGVVGQSMQSLLKFSRELHSSGKFGDSEHPRGAGYWHDAGDHGDCDACKFTTIAKIQKGVVVEKELSADIVSSFIDLPLEMVHFRDAVLRLGMSLRKTSNSDSESPGGVRTPLIEVPDECDQIGSIGECVLRAVVFGHASRGVASQGEDGANPGLRILIKHGLDLLTIMADAGEVWHRGNRSLLNDPGHEALSEFPR